MERETVKNVDKQAPVTLKQKTTDHIDEELRLEIFKTEVFPTFQIGRICDNSHKLTKGFRELMFYP